MGPITADYPFLIPALAQLAHGLGVPDFSPTDPQRVVLRQALCLLDFEMRQLKETHPALIDQLTQWLSAEP